MASNSINNLFKVLTMAYHKVPPDHITSNLFHHLLVFQFQQHCLAVSFSNRVRSRSSALTFPLCVAGIFSGLNSTVIFQWLSLTTPVSEMTHSQPFTFSSAALYTWPWEVLHTHTRKAISSLTHKNAATSVHTRAMSTDACLLYWIELSTKKNTVTSRKRSKRQPITQRQLNVTNFSDTNIIHDKVAWY